MLPILLQDTLLHIQIWTNICTITIFLRVCASIDLTLDMALSGETLDYLLPIFSLFDQTWTFNTLVVSLPMKKIQCMNEIDSYSVENCIIRLHMR